MKNKNFTVKSVVDEKAGPGGQVSSMPVWRIVFTKDDDPPYEHVLFIPHAAFGARVAEYGLDTEDFDTLLDVLIHEQFMTEVHEGDPNFLWNTDQETARLHHLARVTALKREYTHSDPGNFLGVIRNSYDPYSSHHAAMRKLIAEQRAQVERRRY